MTHEGENGNGKLPFIIRLQSQKVQSGIKPTQPVKGTSGLKSRLTSYARSVANFLVQIEKRERDNKEILQIRNEDILSMGGGGWGGWVPGPGPPPYRAL